MHEVATLTTGKAVMMTDQVWSFVVACQQSSSAAAHFRDWLARCVRKRVNIFLK
jgi:hypothetical protein